MDPQQRLLMECVWECVERAGCQHESGAMSQCGFFIGFMGSEYAELAEQENALQMLGSAASTVSGRLAHFFDSRLVDENFLNFYGFFIQLLKI